MTPTPAQTAARTASDAHRSAHGAQVLAELVSLLRLPNLTGQTADLRTNAQELVDRFAARHATMEVVELSGAGPIVVGELRTDEPTATLGIYIHYDAQPVDPREWRTDPFQPVLATGAWHAGGEPLPLPGPGTAIDPEWRLYARSAADDKAPFIAFTAALDALAAAGLPRHVDLVFVFDGEEESGSPHLTDYLRQLAPRLVADAWLLCDGPVHQSRAPQVAFGARGYSGFELTFYGPERELHSGHYGNWVPNPALELATFLAGCKNDQGLVTIDGFYDDTLPISAADQAALDAMPAVEERLREELGFGGAETAHGRYAAQLLRPSFNVRGLHAAAVGASARNVIPAEATASVDIRLAAGDDPERMLDRVHARLAAAGYHVLDQEPTPRERRSHRRLARLVRSPGYPAARIPMDSPLAGTLLAACQTAAGAPVVALPTFGGSIPLCQFEQMLGAPVAVLPIANHDNNQHAADENLRIGNLWYGIDLFATLLTTDFGAIRRG